MAVSPQDRVMGALLLGAPPLAISVAAAAFGAKTVASVFAGLGIAGGVVGAVGAEWFQGKGGPSPLTRGWAQGYEGNVDWGTPSDQKLLADVNTKLKASGLETYAVNGIGGFWALR